MYYCQRLKIIDLSANTIATTVNFIVIHSLCVPSLQLLAVHSFQCLLAIPQLYCKYSMLLSQMTCMIRESVDSLCRVAPMCIIKQKLYYFTIILV